jgi:hypothetical protein
MGLFKILLGPFGLGLPFRPTSKRERFQYQSVAAQQETNQLLERLIESVETGSSGTGEAPRRALTPEEAKQLGIKRMLEASEAQGLKNKEHLAEVWKLGNVFAADVRCVIGERALFRMEDGLTFSLNGLYPEFNNAFSFSDRESGNNSQIDVSKFGASKDLHNFLKAGNRAEFVVEQVEIYEPRNSLKAISDRVQDPNNRRQDAQRIANQQTKYTFKLTRIIETGDEASMSFTAGDIIIGTLNIRSTGKSTVQLHDDRVIEISNSQFPPPYRVREGTSKFWLVESGDPVWLKVLPPKHKGLPENSYSFKVVPPTESNSQN